METARRLMRWCTRYLRVPTLLGLAFVIFMLFFNDNAMGRGMELQAAIDSLQAEIKASADTAARYEDLNRRLATDPETMETVVREHYNMKRAHEDVFVMKQ